MATRFDKISCNKYGVKLDIAFLVLVKFAIKDVKLEERIKEFERCCWEDDRRVSIVSELFSTNTGTNQGVGTPCDDQNTCLVLACLLETTCVAILEKQ